MARTLGIAMALVLLVAPAAEAQTKPSGKLVAGSEETVLRLHDLPPGYRIGDDGGCGSVSPIEGSGSQGSLAKRYLKWLVRYWPEGCFVQYEQLFEVPGLEPSPPLVQAETLNTPSETAAVSGFEIYGALIDRLREGQRARTVALAGTTALLIRTKNELVEGQIHQPGTYLFWRYGKLISFVEAAGMNPRGNDAAALRFAQIQQQRLEHPSPYTEAEQDDTEVQLDDPELKFPIYWLGRRFEPGRGLPPTELSEAFTGEVGPPGQRTALWYEDFFLGTWTRGSWKHYQRSKLGKLNLKSPCARKTDVDLASGRAVVYFGHGGPHKTFDHDRPPAGTCPHSPPKHYWAVAHIGRTVVGVELAICTLCSEDGYGRYNSLKGMKAILQALHVRPKPAYAAAP
jgi:hypothetical protein